MIAIEALSPEKRGQILRGAGIVFAADGYEGASMSRIAAEASVSKGTLYNHFESKAHLFVAFVEAEIAQNLTQLFEGADAGTDPAATLGIIGRRFIRMMLSPTGRTIYRVVVSEAEKFPELARKFYEAGPAQAIGFMSRWLTAQSARGLMRVPDAEFAAEQFFSLCQTRVWFRCKLNLLPNPSEAMLDRVVDGAVEMFLHTYGADTHAA